MAASNVDARILQIQVDYKTAIDQIAKYRSEIDQLRDKQKQLRKDRKDGTIGEQEYQKQMEATRQAITTNNNAIGVLSRQMRAQINQQKEQEGSLKQLRAALSEATAKYDAMSKAERESASGKQLRDHINAITTELKSAEEGTQRFYRNVGNYKSAVDGLKQVENQAKSLGKALLGVFGLVSFGKFMSDVKEVGQAYNDQMAKVRAVTNATDEDFAMMCDEVRRLGSSTRYTASEAGEAMENLTRNGMSCAQATGALESVLHLAQANVIDLGEAADIVTGQLNSFHMSVEQAGHINDVLSWTCANSATNITQLSGALRNTSPIAYTLGISIEELNAAMGALADNNIKGEDAGTKMKQVFVGLSSQAKKAQAVFEKYNLTISETSLREEGLSAALHQLKDSGIMESGHAVDELGKIFGRQAAPSAMALINSLDKLDEKFAIMGRGGMVEAMKNQTEEATEALAKYGIAVDGSNFKLEDLRGVMTKLKDGGIMESKTAMQELNTIFGKDFGQSAMSMLQVLDSMDDGLNDLEGTADRMFEQSFSDTTIAIDSLRSAWEGFMISVYDTGNGEAIPILEDLTTGLQWASQNIESFMQTVMNIIMAFSLAKLITHVKTSGNTMKNSMIANAEAATAKVNALAEQELKQRENVETLKAAKAKASGTERQLIDNKLIIQKQQLAETEKQIESAKNAEITAMQKAAALSTATGWKGAMLSAQMAVQGFVTASKGILKSFALTGILMVAIELIQKLWGYIGEGNGMFSGLGKSISSFCKSALQGLISGIQAVVNWFIETYNNSMYVRLQVKALGVIFSAVWSILKAGIRGIGNGFKLLGGIISGVATALQGLLTLSWEKCTAGIKQLGTAVTDFFKNQWDNVKQTGEEIKDDVLDAYDSLNEKLEPVTIEVNTKTSPTADTSTVTTNTNTETEDPTVTDTGSGGKGKSKKEQDLEAKQRNAELEAAQKLEQELLKIMKDSSEKRRMEVESRYSSEIKKLEIKLKTDKTLTEKARKDINATIVALETQKEEALKKLEFEELKRVVEDQTKLNESKLKLIQKGSEEELALKLANLDLSHQLALQEAQTALEDEKTKQEEMMKIRQKYLDEGNADEVARMDIALAAQTEAIERKNETITLINQQYERDQQTTREENYAAQQEQMRQQVQNQIQEMEMAEEERLLHRNAYRELDQAEFEAQQERQLESIGGFQAEKLRMEEEEAQRQYEALVSRGQLATQTEEQYNAELDTAKQNWLTQQKNINDAYVKNEEAKYNAVKSVTGGLTSLLDTLGKSNEAFAKMSKVVTLAQIAIDTGKALSAGIASASSMPFPANIAAIATTVGTILANIATAISTVKSAKFAEGGKVYGPGSGTSDSIPAYLSNGEFVMTAKATRMFEPLLMAMNGIGNGVPMQVASSYERVSDNEALSESFESAAREIKPVVSVVEITDVQNRVNTIENLDTF